MSAKEYLVVNSQTGIVENILMWDGNTSTWQPPAGVTMLEKAITPAKVWELNQDGTDYVLVVDVGVARVGFTWDGQYAITNLPKPNPTDITSDTINAAVSLMGKYSFTSEPEFQASITEESKQNIAAYLDALNVILENAQIAYDEGRAYAPPFPDEPEIFMLTPGGNQVPVDIGRFK